MKRIALVVALVLAACGSAGSTSSGLAGYGGLPPGQKATYTYVVPYGTAVRIERGYKVDIMPTSLDVKVGEDDALELSALVKDHTMPSPETALLDSDLSNEVSQAMAPLTDRERHIIVERRLVDEPKTLEDLSAKYGISRERVRQIEVRAFDKLQKAMKNMVVDAANESSRKAVEHAAAR